MNSDFDGIKLGATCVVTQTGRPDAIVVKARHVAGAFDAGNKRDHLLLQARPRTVYTDIYTVFQTRAMSRDIKPAPLYGYGDHKRAIYLANTTENQNGGEINQAPCGTRDAFLEWQACGRQFDNHRLWGRILCAWCVPTG